MSDLTHRRSLTMSDSRRAQINLGAAYLGLPSGQAFIDLAIENQLADMAARIPLFRNALRHVAK